MTIKVIEVTLPAYWASYLVNGDASGISDEDLELCDEWLRDNLELIVVSCDGEPYFSRYNDAGTPGAGDVLDYQCHVRE